MERLKVRTGRSRKQGNLRGTYKGILKLPYHPLMGPQEAEGLPQLVQPNWQDAEGGRRSVFLNWCNLTSRQVARGDPEVFSSGAT
jgi:hypothetical protein